MISGDVSSLDLVWRARGGWQEGGVTATRRNYLDYLIDGKSLGDALGAVSLDLIGCLGDGSAAYQEHLVDLLLLQTPAELETGRVALYVCPECGDIGCGAITAVIDQDEDSFIWKEFGLERNYQIDDEPLFDSAGYENIGPFHFNKRQYREALTTRPAKQ